MNNYDTLPEKEYHERLKELKCLYDVGELMQTSDSPERVCQGLMEPLKAAMQFPEITVPVIEIDKNRFAPDSPPDSLKASLSADITPFGEKCGTLSVYYTEDQPFIIPEEQKLIDHIARRLTEWLERYRTEERTEHLNNVIKAIRNVNQMIVREKNRDQLIQQACDNLAETRGYYHVWIALFDSDNTLTGFAHSGLADKASLLNDKLLNGLLPECSRKILAGEKTLITANPALECKGCILQSLYGGRSNIKGRLEYEENFFGIISVSVPMKLAGDSEEIELFDEMAGDISFALYSIQREADLAEERKRLEYILGITRTGVDIIDPKFNLRYVDPAWQKIYGSPAGRKCYEYFMGTDRPCAACGIPQALETRQKVITEEILQRENNRIVEVHTIPFQDKDGQWLAAEFKVDITERKQMEEALRENREQVNSILNAIEDGVGSFSIQEDKHIYISPSVERIFGRKADEFIQNSSLWMDSVYPEDKEAVEGSSKQLHETGFTERVFRIVRPDGTIRWVRNRAKIIYNNAGEPERIDKLLTDITDQKQAEEALRVRERQLSLTNDNFPGIVSVLDRNFCFKYVNKGFEKLFGMPADRFVGKPLKAFLSKENYQKTVGYLQQAMAGRPVSYESTNRIYTSGVIVYGLNTIVPDVDAEGNVIGFFTFGIDITARKRAEALITDKNKELEQIVYVASHDLRSPLVNVEGYGRELAYAVEGLKSAIDSGDGSLKNLESAVRSAIPEMVESLHHIRNSTRQMDAQLKGLLKLSRSGRAALTIKPLDMNLLVSRIFSSFQFEAKEAGAALRTSFLPPCMGDNVQVTQVFSNLISNALKYLEPDRPGVITVSGIMEHSLCTYCVEDNGIGIAPEHQSSIFELFHRLDPGRNAGDGLGLTIVRQILGRIEGDIRVESKPGEGSRFYVTLPHAPEKRRF